MSFGFYRVEDYEIRFSEGRMEVKTPANAFFKINAFNPHVPYEPELEDAVLTLEPITPLMAKVSTPRHVMIFAYNEDPDGPNGQIELDEKVVIDATENSLTLQNDVPREVILTAVSMISGTDYCQQYRVGDPWWFPPPLENNNHVNNNNNHANNNNQSTISNNEPQNVSNYNTNNSNNNLFNGGKHKRRRGRTQKQTRKQKGRKTRRT